MLAMLADWYIAARLRSKYGTFSRQHLRYEIPSCLFDIGITFPWIVWGNLPTLADAVLWILVVLWAFGISIAATRLEAVNKREAQHG